MQSGRGSSGDSSQSPYHTSWKKRTAALPLRDRAAVHGYYLRLLASLCPSWLNWGIRQVILSSLQPNQSEPAQVILQKAYRLANLTIELCVGKGTLCLSGTFNLDAKRSIINPRINKVIPACGQVAPELPRYRGSDQLHTLKR